MRFLVFFCGDIIVLNLRSISVFDRLVSDGFVEVCYTDDVARIILSMKSSSLSSQPMLQKILCGWNLNAVGIKGANGEGSDWIERISGSDTPWAFGDTGPLPPLLAQ